MKAIETVYKGYRFRSRLEARWAVFFDALGIEWEYEIEGFELANGMRYLPDFWLPTFNGGTWCEIKPVGGNLEKPLAFITQSSPGTQLWLCLGSPQLAIYETISREVSPCAGQIGEFCNPYIDQESDLPPMNCRNCGRAIFEVVSSCGIPNYSQAENEDRM